MKSLFTTQRVILLATLLAASVIGCDDDDTPGDTGSATPQKPEHVPALDCIQSGAEPDQACANEFWQTFAQSYMSGNSLASTALRQSVLGTLPTEEALGLVGGLSMKMEEFHTAPWPVWFNGKKATIDDPVAPADVPAAVELKDGPKKQSFADAELKFVYARVDFTYSMTRLGFKKNDTCHSVFYTPLAMEMTGEFAPTLAEIRTVADENGVALIDYLENSGMATKLAALIQPAVIDWTMNIHNNDAKDALEMSLKSSDGAFIQCPASLPYSTLAVD